MIDSRFFQKSGPLSLQEIADLAEGKIVHAGGVSLHDKSVEDITSLDQAGAGSVTFMHNPRYKRDLANVKALACITSQALVEGVDTHIPLILCDQPYRAFAKVATYFYQYKEDAPASEYEQRGSCYVHPSAQIDASVTLGHGVVVGPEVKIGKGTKISHHVTICRGVQIGEHCVIEPQVTLQYALLGNAVVISAGVKIGQAGFGFFMDEKGHVPVPQIGRVVIEDSVEVGSNTTIDRGTLNDTFIGEGTRIDNLVQIGHGVSIGKHCVIVAQVGIAGSTHFDDFVVAAGQAGFAGHLRVGRGARIAAQSGVMKDIEPGATVAGTPSVPVNSWHRQNVMLSKLATGRS